MPTVHVSSSQKAALVGWAGKLGCNLATAADLLLCLGSTEASRALLRLEVINRFGEAEKKEADKERRMTNEAYASQLLRLQTRERAEMPAGEIQAEVSRHMRDF